MRANNHKRAWVRSYLRQASFRRAKKNMEKRRRRRWLRPLWDALVLVACAFTIGFFAGRIWEQNEGDPDSRGIMTKILSCPEQRR